MLEGGGIKDLEPIRTKVIITKSPLLRTFLASCLEVILHRQHFNSDLFTVRGGWEKTYLKPGQHLVLLGPDIVKQLDPGRLPGWICFLQITAVYLTNYLTGKLIRVPAERRQPDLLIEFPQLLLLIFFFSLHLLDLLLSHTLSVALDQGGGGLSLPKSRVINQAQEFTIGS